MKHLVLVGGGAAHVQLMHELAQTPLPGTRITWVAPYPRYVQTHRLSSWVAGSCGIDAIAVPLPPLAAAACATWVESDVAALDAAQRQITLYNGQTLQYDALSVDTEAALDRDAIPGAREHALMARPVEHFIRLWAALLALADTDVLSLVVVGGDVAGAELALAAQQRLGKRARVAWVTGNGPLLSTWPPALQARVRNILKAGQVTLFEDRCAAISGSQMQLGQGMRLACDAPVWVPPPEPLAWLARSGLACAGPVPVLNDAHSGAGGVAPIETPGAKENHRPEATRLTEVLTTATGQSVSHPEVFVRGQDLAAGAVRVPVALRTLNLRRWLAGGPLVAARAAPPRYVLRGGDGTALLSWGPFTLHGRMAEWLASRTARRVVARFRHGKRSAASPHTEAAGLHDEES